MTEDQFTAWLIFVLPLLFCFGNEKFSFVYSLLMVLVFFMAFPLPLLIIAEKEFIRDCKKGYKNWEESIFPQFMYKKIKRRVSNE